MLISRILLEISNKFWQWVAYAVYNITVLSTWCINMLQAYYLSQRWMGWETATNLRRRRRTHVVGPYALSDT